MTAQQPSDPLGLRRIDRTPLAAVIAEEIRAQGPIPFRRFMELALYDPEHGYYSRSAPGPEGDYVTSSELHGAFGALLCAQFEQMWRLLDMPGPFWLIEAGPGTGTFARDVLETAEDAFPEFASALHVALIERSAALRHTQEERLAPWRGCIRWLDADPSSWETIGSGCFFANEVLDAFPVHRVVMREGGLHEVWVGIADVRFVELEMPASLDLADQIAAGGGRLPMGCFAEVNPEVPYWVSSASQLIDRGYLLFIDYGAETIALYSAAHPRGTLRGYQGQVLMDDPLALPGWRDLTAHAELSAVRRAAREAGLIPVGIASQREFLSQLGIERLLDRIGQRILDRVSQRAHRAALELLIDPDGLGALAALAFAKNAPTGALAGFSEGPSREPPDVPSIWSLRGAPTRLGARIY